MRLRYCITAIVLLLFTALSRSADVHQLYELDPTHSTDRIDSISPTQMQNYGPYLFFKSAHNWFSYKSSERTVYRGPDIWRLDTRTNSTTRVINDLDALTDGDSRNYAVLNDRIIYFSTSGLVFADLDGNNKSTVLTVQKDRFLVIKNQMTILGDQLYFRARDKAGMAKLFRTNGRPENIEEIPLCLESRCFYEPDKLMVSGSKLFLQATDTNKRVMLWSINSQRQTQAFTTVEPELSTQEFAPYNNGVIFYGKKALWYTDGTAENSFALNVNAGGSQIDQAVSVGDNLLIVLEDIYLISNRGRGTAKLIMTGSAFDSGVPDNFVETSQGAYFLKNDYVGTFLTVTLAHIDLQGNVKDIHKFDHVPKVEYKIVGLKGTKIVILRHADYQKLVDPIKNEIWISDGTNAGTQKISDNGVPKVLWAANSWLFKDNFLYFAGFSPTQGIELWKTDGAPHGTVLVKDVGFGLPRLQDGALFVNKSNVLYFLNHRWYDPQGGSRNHMELWKTDVKTMQHVKVVTYEQFFRDYYSRGVVAAETGVYFWMPEPETTHSESLFFYHYQTQVTTKIKTFSQLCEDVHIDRKWLLINDFYYFQAPAVTDQNGCELWVSDGITAKPISNFQLPLRRSELSISDMVAFKGEVYFLLEPQDNDGHFLRLYKVNSQKDGVSEVLTIDKKYESNRRLFGAMIATDSGIFIPIYALSNPQTLLYWTPQGYRELEHANRAVLFTRFGDGVAFIENNQVFSVNPSMTGFNRLFIPQTDGRLGDIVSTLDFQRLIYSFYFENGDAQVWLGNGSAAGTIQLKSGKGLPNFRQQIQVGTDLYLSYSYNNPRPANSFAKDRVLMRHSLNDATSELIYTQTNSLEYEPIDVREVDGRIVVAKPVSPEPQTTGPYLIGRLDDGDTDKDGVLNRQDIFPFHADEQLDFDGDGIGNNADTDDDGDEVPDRLDLFPRNNLEASDQDLDGIGDNADNDDDNDGVSDWMDSYPIDSTKSNNKEPTPPPVVDPVAAAEKSGGVMNHLWLVAGFLLVIRRRGLFAR